MPLHLSPLAEKNGDQHMSRLDWSQLDPLQSPVLRRELPGLPVAFDPESMRWRLQEALFGETRPMYVIETCDLKAPGSNT